MFFGTCPALCTQRLVTSLFDELYKCVAPDVPRATAVRATLARCESLLHGLGPRCSATCRLPIGRRAPQHKTRPETVLEISAKLSKEALSGITVISAMALRNKCCKYYGFSE